MTSTGRVEPPRGAGICRCREQHPAVGAFRSRMAQPLLDQQNMHPLFIDGLYGIGDAGCSSAVWAEVILDALDKRFNKMIFGRVTGFAGAVLDLGVGRVDAYPNSGDHPFSDVGMKVMLYVLLDFGIDSENDPSEWLPLLELEDQVGGVVDVTLSPMVGVALVPHLRPASLVAAMRDKVFELLPFSERFSIHQEDPRLLPIR